MILVTGGTGLIGSHLLFHILQKEGSVRAIYRQKDYLEKVRQVFGYYASNAQALVEKIEWVEADILDIPALDEAFTGIRQVYHCAALISFDPRDTRALHKTNVEGTANVINCCLRHNKT